MSKNIFELLGLTNKADNILLSFFISIVVISSFVPLLREIYPYLAVSALTLSIYHTLHLVFPSQNGHRKRS